MERRIIFRLSEDDLAYLDQCAEDADLSRSAFLRELITNPNHRVFYDPVMTEAVAGCRMALREIAKVIQQYLAKVDHENRIQIDIVNEMKKILISIYHKQDQLEQILKREKEVLLIGDHQANGN